MRDTTFIYCLTEPGTKTIRYFGKADNPRERRNEHIQAAKNGEKWHVSCWIRKLLQNGQRPDVHALCEVIRDDFERFERAFIALGRQCGIQLTNLTDGGDGPSGRVPSAETRAKISAAGKGQKKPEGFGQKISARLRGVKKLPAHRQNISLARSGSKDSDATSKFIGVSFIRPKGKVCSKPWRAAIYLNKTKTQIGNFSSEREAAKAYDSVAKTLQGVKLNFPEV